MTMVGTLLSYRWRAARKAAQQANWAQVVVASVYIMLALAAVVGAYTLFMRGFGFILADAAGPLVLRYVFETAFALVLLLGVISFIMSSFGLIFRNREIRLLGTMPVPPSTLFLYTFTGALILSSWPALFLAAPALAALGVAAGAGPVYYLSSLIVLLLFVLLIGLMGCLASFAVAPLVRRVSTGRLTLVQAGVFGALSFLFIRHIMPRSVFTMFVDATAGSPAAEAAAARLDVMFGWLPSHAAVRVMLGLAGFRPDASVAADAALLVAGVAAVSVALYLIARRWYFPLWQAHHETGLLARPQDVKRERSSASFPRVLRWRHGFLFEKEALILLRDPGEISRGLFLVLLLFFYIVTARAVALMEAFSRVELYAWVVAFAFAAIGYFALTLGLRFVFPSPSIEGKSAWVIWSSPVHPHEIYSWKFFFWSFLLLGVLEAVATLTVMLFGLPLPLGQFFAFAVFLTVISIVSITLGQGTIFPNFHEKDPDTLATSPAGLAATAVGLLFVWVMTRYVHGFTLAFLDKGRIDTLAMFGMLVVSLALTGAYWAAAGRSADHAEVT